MVKQFVKNANKLIGSRNHVANAVVHERNKQFAKELGAFTRRVR